MQQRLFIWQAAAYIYCACLFGRIPLRMVLGDDQWWLFVLNTYALYLFALLPLVVLLAWRTRSRMLWYVAGAAMVMGGFQYGELFAPRLAPLQSEGHPVTVMTYNVRRQNPHTDDIIAVLRNSNADVIAIQELNDEVTRTIRQELLNDYPHQLLEPEGGFFGLGIISRYPILPYIDTETRRWSRSRQLMLLEIAGQRVLLINQHASSPNIAEASVADALDAVANSSLHREEQAEEIRDLARTVNYPVLMLGDLNTGDQSRAYSILTETLQDGWREAGWGFGHTFPASSGFIISGTRVGIPLPTLPVRIDYVLYSSEWRALKARVGSDSGGSDHQPLIVELWLHEPDFR